MSYWVAGAVIVSALYSASQKPPSLPAPQAPAAPPQQSKAPDAGAIVDQMKGTGQAGGSPGVASTFLTGAQGVNQNSLNLGKSTLLGG